MSGPMPQVSSTAKASGTTRPVFPALAPSTRDVTGAAEAPPQWANLRRLVLSLPRRFAARRRRGRGFPWMTPREGLPHQHRAIEQQSTPKSLNDLQTL